MKRRLFVKPTPLLFGAMLLAAPAACAAPASHGCGATVVLVGEQGDWRAPPVHCSAARPATFDARKATFRSMRIAGATGIVVRGGRVGVPGLDMPAVTVDGSHEVHLTGMTMIGARVGVTFVRGTDYQIDQSRFDGLRSDGVIINQAQRVTIDRNTFTDFHPVPGDHPDGIQAFSLAGQTPNRDLVFTNNQISGAAQGIDNFGDAAGTTNVRVEGNVIVSTFWHGIAFSKVENLIVRNNIVRTSPGATQGNPPRTVQTWLRVDNNTNVNACGNTVPAFPRGPGTKACR